MSRLTLVFLILGIAPMSMAVCQVPCDVTPVQCCDGIDNDSDGFTDWPDDLYCLEQFWIHEAVWICNDNLDNDDDGLIDYPEDPECASISDSSESILLPACSDGNDNDSDGATDFPDDTDCADANDTSEMGSMPQCSDGVDNDLDGLSDFPDDPGCSTPDHNREFSAPQCGDHLDNDSDGLTNFPDDPDCLSIYDRKESPAPQCSDGADNDGDCLADYPFDPDCLSADDDQESGPSPLIFADDFETGDTCEWSTSTAACPLRVLDAIATSPTEVVVTFNRGLDPASLFDVTSQFIFDGALIATEVVASASTAIVTTTTQTPFAIYTVTVAASVTDLQGNGVDPSENSAVFSGFDDS